MLRPCLSPGDVDGARAVLQAAITDDVCGGCASTWLVCAALEQRVAGVDAACKVLEAGTTSALLGDDGREEVLARYLVSRRWIVMASDATSCATSCAVCCSVVLWCVENVAQLSVSLSLCVPASELHWPLIARSCVYLFYYTRTCWRTTRPPSMLLFVRRQRSRPARRP